MIINILKSDYSAVTYCKKMEISTHLFSVIFA